jgi:glycine oxidase
LFPDDAQVEPRALMRALQLAAARAGVAFQTGYVRRVVCDGARARAVDLEGERLEADAIVLCAGSWTGLVDGAGLPPQAVRPIRGQMLELETRLPLVRHVLFSGHGYVVPRKDGRVLCGSTMEQVGFKKETTAGGLRAIADIAIEIAPALVDAPVLGFWANFRPRTEDGLPLLGPSPIAGLHLCTGHFRNGILLAPASAELVADAVIGRAPRLDLEPYSLARFAPSL